MKYFRNNTRGDAEFRGGREAWELAVRIAEACPAFLPDEEEEWVSDQERSCYNCRYRRWTVSTFVCMKQAEPEVLSDSEKGISARKSGK